jgi:hypothetical protein
MKFTIHIAVLSAILCVSGFAMAQSATTPGDKPAMPPRNQDFKNKMEHKIMEAIPEELRDRFKTARDAAMADSAIQDLKKKADEASDTFRSAVRETMVKSDPELAASAKKIADKWKENFRSGPPPKDKRKQLESVIQTLPSAEKDKFEKAREIARQTPAVQTAEAKMKNAQNPQDRQASAMEYHEAMRTAILTADPTLAPVIDKIRNGMQAAPLKSQVETP